MAVIDNDESMMCDVANDEPRPTSPDATVLFELR